MNARKLDLKELKKIGNSIARGASQEEMDKYFEIIEQFYLTHFKKPFESFDESGLNLLHWSIVCQQNNKTKQLVEYGMDINARTKKYDRYCVSNVTPIWFAVKYDNVEIAQFLLNKNPDLSIRPINTFYDDGLINGEYEEDLSSVTTLAKRSESKEMVKLFEGSILNEYIQKRENDPREYQHSFSLFCHKFNFGYSKTKKLSGANELKELIEKNADYNAFAKFGETHPEVKQGSLGEVFKTSLKVRR